MSVLHRPAHEGPARVSFYEDGSAEHVIYSEQRGDVLFQAQYSFDREGRVVVWPLFEPLSRWRVQEVLEQAEAARKAAERRGREADLS